MIINMNKQKVLQEKGLKITTARVEVLDLLERKGDPSDVVFIVDNLKTHADQATIYRVIEVLTKNGIVNKIDFGDGKYRYELAGDHHHHLICTSCSRIEDVEGESLKNLEKQIRDKNRFLIKSHSLEFFGLCQNCQS